MKYLLPFLLALLAPAVCHAALGEREFAEDMLKRFAAADGEIEMRIKDREPLTILARKSGESADAQINLDSIFRQCNLVAGKECDDAKDRFVTAVLAPSPEVRRDALRIIVRDASYLEAIGGMNVAVGSRLITRPIGDDLRAMLAIDGPDSISLALESDVAGLGLSEDDAWQLAMDQTRGELPDIPAVELKVKQAVALQDVPFLASLLADLDAWQKIASQIGPDFMAAVASDDFVFLGFMPDGEELKRFRQVVRDECEAAPRCVSPNVYRFRGGRWVMAK